jgi:pectin methylesterase-like acyl-CoA thioesterase/polygalacturonase
VADTDATPAAARRLRRGLAALGAAALAAGLLTALPGLAAAATGVTLTVAQSGAEYTSVQAAVNAVPENPTVPYTILIGPGTYHETVTIPSDKPDLTLRGSTGNPADVVITGANYNGETDPAGGTYGTEGSATVHAQASDFTAEYITFANTFDKNDFPTVTGTQAVALAMEGDRQVYRNDIFYGHQDTLLSWDSSPTTTLRQYVYDSTIEGDVDFIFGNGSLVVDRSQIVALNDGIYTKAYLTAPATYGTNPYGILITGSTVTSTLAPNDIYLGRAWVPYTGAVPQLVVRDTNLPAQVNATDPYLGISSATWTAGRYGEYDNTGYGASPANPDRPQLTDAQATGYTAQAYLAGSDGWDPVAPAAGGTVASLAQAQSSRTGDTRHITQPRLPATCQTLTATLPAPTGELFPGAAESAPPDTARIQAALNACAGTGQAVVLAASPPAGGPGSGPPDTAFLSAPLTIGNDEYLVIGAGATLYASRNAADYQVAGDPACGSIGTSSSGCNAFITVTGVDSGIEGEGFGPHQGSIDGRGGQDILGTSTTWWQVAATATAEGLKQVNPRLIQATDANNLTIYNLTIENAAKEHLYYKNGGGLVVWGLHVVTPDNTYNTDGIDFDSSAYGTIRDSVIQDGDDCVAMQTNNATDAHITVAGNQCYGTHGISIGSETTYGLESILVEHDFIDGRDSSGTESTIPAGIRVKSYAGAGGTVTDVRYLDITMRSLLNPIDIDPFYDPATGTSDPYFKDIEIDGATETGSVAGAESVLDGFSAADPLGLTLRDVHFDVTATTAQDANITEVDSNLAISGPGVTVTRAG